MPSRRFKKTGALSPQHPALDHRTKNEQISHPKPQHNAPATVSLWPPKNSLAPIPVTPPPSWPPSLPYLTHPILSSYLPPSHLKWLSTRPQPPDDLPVIVLPSSPCDIGSRVEIRVISDEGHPAYGQRGLFAARDLAPDELVVCYLGYVHGSTAIEKGELERQREIDIVKQGDTQIDVNLNAIYSTSAPNGISTPSNTEVTSPSPSSISQNSDVQTIKSTTTTDMLGSWDTSSYDLNMYRSEDIEIAVDALQMGNEARFVNDYRGVPAQTHDLGGVGEGEKGRRGKRRVKGWEAGDGDARGHGNGYGFENGSGDGDGNRGELNSHGNGLDIAIPNAEFRDVWFDIPEHINLTLSVSSSSLNQQPHDKDNNHISSLNTINAILENTHLTDTSTTITTTTMTQPNILTNQTKNKIIDDKPKPPRRKKKNGIRGVAVFVMPAGKAGKRKGGIKKGQEVLVSYGKGFWAYHGGEGEEGGAG